MTPIPGIPCSSSRFRQEHEHGASCYDMQSKQPIPADYPRDRSIIAGNTIDTSSWRRQPPIIEKSLLSLKKRATSSDASSSGAGDSFVILPPKKRRVEDATSADGVPVQAHAPPKPSSSVTSELPADDIQHERSEGVRYARRLFPQAASNGPMAAAAARAKKKKKTNKNDRPRQSARGAELSGCLEALGAKAVQFVRTKTINTSDVCSNQNRLLMSCKPEFVADHAITRLLSAKEAYFVFEHGLRVNAYDGEGRQFDMRLRYLVSNGGFRLIDRWRGFVEKNELVGPVTEGRHHVDVELWAFRSKQLPEQPKLDDGDRQEMVDGLKDHKDGNLGLLVLPYVDDGEGRVEEDEERALPTVNEAKRKRASAKVVRKKRKLPDCASRGKKAVAREVTLSEMIVEHGMELAMSVAGLLKLTHSHVVPPV